MTRARLACLFALMLLCGGAEAADPMKLGLPPIPYPAGNSSTPDKVALGKKLFFDTRLAADGKMACATCHDPAEGFTTNGSATHPGSGGWPLKRNAPTVLNAAFEQALLWNGGMPSLEALAWGPMLNAEEMANLSATAVLERISALPDYAGMFERAFAGAGASKEIGRAHV